MCSHISILISILTRCGAQHHAEEGWTGDNRSRTCNRLVGWRRIVQLYASHWDSVAVITVGDVTSTSLEKRPDKLDGGIGTSGGALNPSVNDVPAAVLCGAPLALNRFGAKVLVGGAPCAAGWASAGGGRCLLKSPALSQVTRGPSWRRRAVEQQHKLTRVFSTAAVPDFATLNFSEPDRSAWMLNQHDSAHLRPADVAIHVVGPDIEHGALQLQTHLRVQVTETLHAVLVLGDVCKGLVRCVAARHGAGT